MKLSPEIRTPSGIDVLEQAIQLLRRQPPGVWLVQLAGAVPLLLSTLYFLSDMRLGGFSVARSASESLLCAICFLWFNTCRARFSHLLSASLSTGAAGSWKSATNPANLSLQMLKPYALPAAICMILPAASAISFFRTLAVLPGEYGVLEAARFGGVWKKQNWEMLGALAAFSVVVFLNVLVVLAILPVVAQSALGMENAFTRMGTSFSTPTFSLVIALTWLALDPLYQAAYVVRYFLIESRRTGLDLLVSLTRLGILALALVLCGKASAVSPAGPRDLDRSISQVFEQREYSWHNQDEPMAGMGAIVHVLQSLKTSVNRALYAIGEFFKKLFPSEPAADKDKQPQSAFSVGWTLAILGMLTALGLAGFTMIVLRRASNAVPPPVPAGAPFEVALDDSRLTAADLPEERWLELARECADRQEFRLALRAMYLANLSYLGHRQLLKIAPAKSNRDYRNELAYRVRNENVSRVFAENVRTFEQGWYGTREVYLEHVDLVQRNLADLRTYVEA